MPASSDQGMDKVGRLLVELAADEDYLGPLIAEIPSEEPGGKWLVKPERGPRLVLFHRPEGVMAYTHSHHCWVGIAPVRGVETHQRWDAVRHEDGRAELRLEDDRAMTRGDVATLIPPGRHPQSWPCPRHGSQPLLTHPPG
jgi:predicted metal-dependent enzyme (double-stranded beta helix superfamily)